jgi:hypothetical protein
MDPDMSRECTALIISQTNEIHSYKIPILMEMQVWTSKYMTLISDIFRTQIRIKCPNVMLFACLLVDITAPC